MTDHEAAVVEPEGADDPGRRDERGMTTAEYAVGTVAAVSFGGILLKILTDDNLRNLIMQIILWILRTVTGVELG